MRPNFSLLLFTSLFVWGAFYFLWVCYGKPVAGIDDANIYLVYMRNLAGGHGLVYQPGGEKVEGFTSLLWVFIGAFFYRFTAQPEWGLLIFNILIINILMVVLNHRLNEIHGREGLQFYHLFFLLLLLLVPGYFDWTVLTLMETALWSLLLTLLVLRVSDTAALSKTYWKTDNRVISLLLFLLLLTRPESMLWGALLLGIRIGIFRYKGYTWKAILYRNMLPVGVWLFTLVALIGWRLWYFGYPFPNTYYAKVSSQPLDNLKTGFVYLVQFFIHYNPLALAMFALSLGWAYQVWRLKKFEPGTFPLFILVLASLLNLLFPLLTGGDHFYLGRILQPLMPITCVVFTFLFFKLVDVKLDAFPARIIQGVFGVLVLFTAMLLPDQFRFYRYPMATAPFQYEFYLAEKGRTVGLQMNTFFRAEKNKPVWGVLCAGGIAYTYEGITLDLLGLNNVAMAHANPVKPTDRPKNHGSFDKDVFYKQQPDIMYPTQFIEDASFAPGPFEKSDTFQTDFLIRSVDHIHRDAYFKSLYVPVLLTSKSDGAVLYSYFRRAYLPKLDTALYEVRYLWETK